MELAIVAAAAGFGAGWIGCWALQSRPLLAKLITMRRLGFVEVEEGPVRELEPWELFRED